MNIVGIDEVGRGALAGPALVGVCLQTWEDDAVEKARLEAIAGVPLRDSKKMTPRQRKLAVERLMGEVVWTTGAASVQEINEHGIVPACSLAVDRAITALAINPDHIQADAGLRPGKSWSTVSITHSIRGESEHLVILLAALIAKVTRDALMVEHADARYGFANHKGYASAEHRAALAKHGLSVDHRTLFCHSYLNG